MHTFKIIPAVLIFIACNLATGAPLRPKVDFTSDQRLRADRLISVFENSTLEIQYDYVQDIHDGCGYTTGRAGFCTSQGDLLEVVELYTKAVPGNPLAPFLPRLRVLAKEGSESTAGLNGYPAAVAVAAQDPQFRAAQDQVVTGLYFTPAVDLSNAYALKYPFSLAALYETGVQFGWGNELTSVPTMAATAKKVTIQKYGSFSEALWLQEFLTMRRDYLANSPIQAARDAVGRGNAMLRLLATKNYDFHGPFTITPYSPDESFTIP